MPRIASSLLCFLLVITTASSFYLSAAAPRDFRRGDELEVKVNKLLSTKTLLPYHYYYLRYCRPPTITNVAQNLGEFLRGDRNSVYTFHMNEEQPCTIICRIFLNAEAAKDFKEKIDDEYRVNMILDDLPVVARRQNLDGSPSTIYEQGFGVGFKGFYSGSEEYFYYIFNHLSFSVMYHKDEETNSARIVGFEVTPNSIKHEFEWYSNASTCRKSTRYMIEKGGVALQQIDAGKEITFSYDVAYKESEIGWPLRWDAYLLIDDDQIRWFSIANSLLIMLLLCSVVATVMIRTLQADIASRDEAREETGWKMVSGDVCVVLQDLVSR